MDLKGQIAIISGGLGDIGRAIGLELARHGADIAVGDILPSSKADAFVKRIKSLRRQARYDRVDVSDAKAVEKWMRDVEKTLGVPTLIIPNAAIVTLKTFRTLTAQEWRRELAINLDGAFHLAHCAALRMVARKKKGRFVFIGSWAGGVTHRGLPAYCVAKAGLRMLMMQFAREFAEDGILVNEVAPGFVDAGLSGRVFAKSAAIKRGATKRVPIRKLISAEEVAMQVAHLCDPENRQMTGSVVLMDGGLSLGQQ